MLIFIYQFIQILIAVILHEIAHGYAAYLEGDDTAKKAGRLSLNPLVHIDPFFTIIFPLLLILSGSPVVFGGARPVPVNPYNFKRGKLSDVLVASAGVLTNLLLAIVNTAGLKLFPALSDFFLTGIIINTVLFAFNILPIPPLDGSRIIFPFLPYDLKKLFVELERFGILLIFLFLYFFGSVIWKIVEPIVNILLWF